MPTMFSTLILLQHKAHKEMKFLYKFKLLINLNKIMLNCQTINYMVHICATKTAD